MQRKQGDCKKEEGFPQPQVTSSSLQENHTSLGCLNENKEVIWAIDGMPQRIMEAEMGMVTYLHTPPFFTHQYGYKIVLHLFVNSNGYISFFMTIIRGEYDDRLRWPFKNTVTVTLVDQDNKYNVSCDIEPTPCSPSFRKPKSEVNNGAGSVSYTHLTLPTKRIV